MEREFAGIRLLDLLAKTWPTARTAELRHLVAAGSIAVNGEVCLADRALRPSDVVQVAAVPTQHASVSPSGLPAVLHETATMLVVLKPAGLTTVPDRSGKDRGVHGLLESLRPGADLRIVHRLDRDTSGCLLLAKGLEAARHFDAQFREGGVAKTYVALVHGVPTHAEFTVDAWLGPDRRRPGKVVAATAELVGFKAAHTRVTVRQGLARHALLALQPTTGRSHQLRVHLQSVGHPIVGDADYGGAPLLLSALKSGYKLRAGVAERPLCDRMFLHAERVVCRDVDGGAIDVTAPLPDDLQVALRQLQNFDDRRRRPCD